MDDKQRENAVENGERNTTEGFKCECSNDIGCLDGILSSPNRFRANGTYHLCTVDESESIFCFESVSMDPSFDMSESPGDGPSDGIMAQC